MIPSVPNSRAKARMSKRPLSVSSRVHTIQVGVCSLPPRFLSLSSGESVFLGICIYTDWNHPNKAALQMPISPPPRKKKRPASRQKKKCESCTLLPRSASRSLRRPRNAASLPRAKQSPESSEKKRKSHGVRLTNSYPFPPSFQSSRLRLSTRIESRRGKRKRKKEIIIKPHDCRKIDKRWSVLESVHVSRVSAPFYFVLSLLFWLFVMVIE